MSSKGNKKAKEALIRLYGAECFIEKLHLRQDTEPRKYTGKAQYKRMKELSYHHILEKKIGGKATIENGALLSVENHAWFNKQSRAKQEEMNEKFQQYKADFLIGIAEITTEGVQQAEVYRTEQISEQKEVITIPAYDISEEEWQKFKAERNKRVLESPKWGKGR